MRGVGIDIAHIPRFAAALNRWGSARLCARILHPQEVVDFDAKSKSNQAQFLASRFFLCVVLCVVVAFNFFL
jgi:phosphopantetheine--protein transferase-like protein